MEEANGRLGDGMTDAELVQRFEDCTLPNDAFHHQDHVRLAWLYLRQYPALEALTRFADGLKRFAAANGRAGLYHETITWAYLFLIHERMAEAAPGEAWEGFAARNPDLLVWKPSILDRYYPRETLFSDRARRLFVMPEPARTEGADPVDKTSPAPSESYSDSSSVAIRTGLPS